jgi:hypothetical protein
MCRNWHTLQKLVEWGNGLLPPRLLIDRLYDFHPLVNRCGGRQSQCGTILTYSGLRVGNPIFTSLGIVSER